MATQTYSPFNTAPKWAQHSSTFSKDDRCYETDLVTGDIYSEVLDRTVELWLTLREGTDKMTDYDVNYDNVGDCYVGVVCCDN